VNTSSDLFDPDRLRGLVRLVAGHGCDHLLLSDGLRSIRIDGHSTSIQLEATFWALLDEIADSQGLTTPKFISKLYDEAIEINGAIPNFASMLRTTCALYLRGHRPVMDELAPKREAA